MTKTHKRRWLGWAVAVYGVLTLVAMAPMSLGAGLLGGMVLFYLMTDPEFRTQTQRAFRSDMSKKYVMYSVLFLAACALSLVGAILYPVDINGTKPQIFFFSDFSKSWYFLWPLAISWALSSITQKERTNALRAWLIAFGLLSCVGIIQYFTGWPRPQGIPGNEGRYHATLFLGHHLSVASIWIFPFFAALDLLSKKNREARLGFSKNVLAAMVVVGGVTLFLTYSRALWVAMIPGILLWCWLSFSKKWAAAASFAIVLVSIAAIQVPAIHKRVHDSLGVGTRWELWQANWEFFKSRPLTGVGMRKNEGLSSAYLEMKYPGKDNFIGHAHNNFLEILAGNGLFGIITWFFWCGFAILISSRIKLFSNGMISAWLVFHLNGLTQLNFWEGKVEHQMMWILGWALFMSQREINAG